MTVERPRGRITLSEIALSDPGWSGKPVQFRALDRWDTAKPAHLAGAPPSSRTDRAVLRNRLTGLPFMPPTRRRLPIRNAIVSSKDQKNASDDTQLFLLRGADRITLADKVVTWEHRFAVFHLPFPRRVDALTNACHQTCCHPLRSRRQFAATFFARFSVFRADTAIIDRAA